MDERLKKIPVVTMCDIDNPMYGKSGAAYIFAPQKGADEDMVRNLDDNLKKFAAVIEKETGKKMSRQNLTQRLGRDNFQEQDMRLEKMCLKSREVGQLVLWEPEWWHFLVLSFRWGLKQCWIR